MKILKGPEKGRSQPLEISETKSNRVVVGLSWDPKQSKALDNIGKFHDPDNNMAQQAFSDAYDMVQTVKHAIYMKRSQKTSDYDGQEVSFTHYDLDLHCFAYDNNGAFLYELSPSSFQAIDESETTYHSGEDFSGLGGYDDERVCIETKTLPDNYTHFFFVVKSDSKHSLLDIPSAELRLADSKTETNFSEVQIAPEDGDTSTAFVYAHLYKTGDSWHMKTIGEYGHFETNWQEELKKHISA